MTTYTFIAITLFLVITFFMWKNPGEWEMEEYDDFDVYPFEESYPDPEEEYPRDSEEYEVYR